MLFIGDVHGKYGRYDSIIKNCKHSIQVGDMGVGFIDPNTNLSFANPPYDRMKNGNHRFIRGNHDNPNVCKNHSQWIKDGTFNIEKSIMYIGGALSIDRADRILGHTWWNDEELSIPILNGLITEYEIQRPRVMVTHTCPESIISKLFKTIIDDPCRTQQAFSSMFSIHKPELWIFGHWHESRNVEIEGTRFICLAELETKELEI